MSEQKGRLTINEFEHIIDMRTHYASNAQIATYLGKSMAVTRWILEFIDANGKEKAIQCLVNGQYETYDEPTLLEILAQHVKNYVSLYRLEIVFGTSRNNLRGRFKSISSHPELMEKIKLVTPRPIPQRANYLAQITPVPEVKPKPEKQAASAKQTQSQLKQEKKEPVPPAFGNPSLKEIRKYSKGNSKRKRNIDSATQEKNSVTKPTQSKTPSREQIAQERAEKIQKVLGPIPRLTPASQYNPLSVGAKAFVDPNSEGFDEYPPEIKKIMLSRFSLLESIRNKARELLGYLPDEQLLMHHSNLLRYELLDDLQEAFPKVKPSFIRKAIGLSQRMNYYYKTNPVVKDKYASILDTVRQCFYAHQGKYGRQRLCQALRDEHGIYLCVETVRKLMLRLGLSVRR